MATYRNADGQAHDLIRELIEAYHGSLKDTGVRIGALFAFAPRDEETGEPTTAAIKKYGLPACSMVRIVSQRDRIAGLPDAQIILDGEAWEREWSDEHKRAVIDRCLQYIEVQLDEEGGVKLDDCNRPRLRIIPPDYLISGFRVIAERHGDESVEVKEARKVQKVYGQLLFDFEPVGA